MKTEIIFLIIAVFFLPVRGICGGLIYDSGKPEIRMAAGDLVRCLEAVTGKELSEFPFNMELRQENGLSAQEWHLQSDGGKLVISGTSSAGIVYGVYTFLEKYAGCFWPAPDTEVLPRNSEWKLQRFDERGKPVFSRREMYVGYDFVPGIWRLRNKENYRALHLNMSVGSPRDCHTLDNYVKTLRKKRPDLFFQAISGAGSQSVCMTHPEVRKVIFDQLVAYIRKDRKQSGREYPEIYDISQSDGGSGSECYCSSCRKIAEEEGSYSGPNLYFVNALAKEIGKLYPDIFLRTFAYSYTLNPPKSICAAENVIVRFCGGYLFDPLVRESELGRKLVEWGSHAAHKAVWSYWKDYLSSYEYPYVKKHRDIVNEIRFCRNQGVIHYFAENENPLSRSFAMYQHYLMLKLLDNPDQDAEMITDRFMAGYYGPAARPLRSYLEYLEKRQEKTKAYLDRAFFETVNGLLDEAERLAAGNKLYLRHIGWERSVVDRAMFNNLNQLQSAGYRMDLRKCARRFEKNAVENICAWDGFRWKKDLREQRIRDIRREAQLYARFPVALPRRFKGCRVLDRQWCQVHLTGNYEYVSDRDAVCGVAFRSKELKHGLPFTMGFYHRIRKTGEHLFFSGENIPTDEKFHLYKIGSALMDHNLYMYFDNSWRFRTYLNVIGIVPEFWDIWVSVKFTGPVYVRGSANANAVLFDRILFVQEPDPMLKYHQPDVSLNRLRNGGFEKGFSGWIPDWGKPNAYHDRDSTVKHSGKYSLKIGNVPNHYDFAAFPLGRPADWEHDLLIQGWCRYEKLDDPDGKSLPFFGLWGVTDQGKNSGFVKSVVSFYPGNREWTKFQYLVRRKDILHELEKYSGKRKISVIQLRINLCRQWGMVWLDDLQVIPLKSKNDED